MSEPCLCGSTDCYTCGPMQGYHLPKRYPLGSLSAEDCDILNEEYRAEQAAADEEAELYYREMEDQDQYLAEQEAHSIAAEEAYERMREGDTPVQTDVF